MIGCSMPTRLSSGTSRAPADVRGSKLLKMDQPEGYG